MTLVAEHYFSSKAPPRGRFKYGKRLNGGDKMGTFHGGIILFLFGMVLAIFSGGLILAGVGSAIAAVGLASIKYLPQLEITF